MNMSVPHLTAAELAVMREYQRNGRVYTGLQGWTASHTAAVETSTMARLAIDTLTPVQADLIAASKHLARENASALIALLKSSAGASANLRAIQELRAAPLDANLLAVAEAARANDLTKFASDAVRAMRVESTEFSALIKRLSADARQLTELTDVLPSLRLSALVSQAFAAGLETHVPTVVESLGTFPALRTAALLSAELRSNLNAIIGRVDLSVEQRRMLASLDRLTDATTTVWDRFATDPIAFGKVPPKFRAAPIVETVGATRVVLWTIDPEKADDDGDSENVSETGLSLGQRLGAIHPALSEAYAGLHTRFSERGPDYIRQASTSARELLDHFLVLAAPDAEVVAWDNRAENYENGNLTRKARLRFVFRELLMGDEFARVVTSDIELILQIFYPLNRAVHSLDPGLAHKQLARLILRVDYAIQLVLEALEGWQSG